MKTTFTLFFATCLSTCALFFPHNQLLSALIISADTYNERHVQGQLNGAVLPPADIATAIANINALPPSHQRDALNELSGEQYTNLVQSNQVGSQQFMRRLFEPVRYDSLGLHCGENCDQYQFWGAVGGGHAYQHGSKGADGYKLSDYNIAIGAQKPLNFCFLDSWLTVGLAGYYERDSIHFNLRGSGRASNWEGALYYMWNNCRFYSFSATILGSDCIRVRRPIDIGNLHRRARGRAYITQWTSYSEAGLNLNPSGCYYIQPFVGFEYAFYRRHALSERHTHSLALHIRGKNVSATIGRLGVHVTTTLPWDLFLTGDVAWRYRFNFLQERIQVNFRDFGAQFRIKGVHLKPHGIEGAINIAKCFCDCWQAYVEIAGEKWDRYSAWNVSGGLNMTW